MNKEYKEINAMAQELLNSAKRNGVRTGMVYRHLNNIILKLAKQTGDELIWLPSTNKRNMFDRKQKDNIQYLVLGFPMIDIRDGNIYAPHIKKSDFK